MSKPTPRTISAVMTKTQTCRVLTDYVLSSIAPGYVGRVRAMATQWTNPIDGEPDGLRIDIDLLGAQPKAKRGRKIKVRA